MSCLKTTQLDKRLTVLQADMICPRVEKDGSSNQAGWSTTCGSTNRMWKRSVVGTDPAAHEVAFNCAGPRPYQGDCCLETLPNFVLQLFRNRNPWVDLCHIGGFRQGSRTRAQMTSSRLKRHPSFVVIFAWGARARPFKSAHPDQLKTLTTLEARDNG